MFGRRHAGAAVVLVCAAALLVLLADAVLGRFPHSADEYAFRYQARTFAAGRLRNPPAPEPAIYAPAHIISTEDATYSKYPPGWPAILTLGVLAHADFLVNPLVSVAVLVATWQLASAMAGSRVAFVALVLLASNPFFLLNGASWYSHPLVALALLGCVTALWRGALDAVPGPRHALVAGGALAVVVLTRPQDLVPIVVGLLPALMLLAHRRGLRALAPLLGWAAAPVALALVVYAFYNLATNGHPLLFGHQVAASEDLPSFDLTAMIRTLGEFCDEWLRWSPVTLLALGAPLLARRAPGTDDRLAFALIGGLTLAFALGYSLYYALTPRYGPRFLLPVLPLVMIAAAMGLARLLPPRWLSAGVVVLVGGQLLQLGVMARSLHVTIEAARGLDRAGSALEQAIHPRKALVLVAGPAGSVPNYDLVRNDLDLSAPVVFVRARPKHPPEDRSVFVWDGVGGVPALWADDPREPVRAVFATRPIRVVRGQPGPGWLRTRGSSACADATIELVGQRPVDWARFGPCADAGELRRVARPDESGANAAPPNTWSHYRSFLRVDEPGRYQFRLESDGESRVKVDGRSIARTEPGVRRFDVGRIFLRPGTHPVSLSHWAPEPGGNLRLSVIGPDGKEVEAERLTILPPMRSANPPLGSPSGPRPAPPGTG